MGGLTACIAFLVDLCEATVNDWKGGYCTDNYFASREICCRGKTPLLATTTTSGGFDDTCEAFHEWSTGYGKRFAVYGAFAVLFASLGCIVTMFTKGSLPATAPGTGHRHQDIKPGAPLVDGKTLYMAAGSGVPEIKTILSGFVIPGYLDFKVLVVKAVGAVFAVGSGLSLGKEGPFIHIATSVAYLVANRLPKYKDNGRKMREMLSVGSAAGISVAFGAPIGGVLFSYEEISTYFPKKVLWRAFLCSLSAAVFLKALNPNGTGKLALFETDYGTSYKPIHYLVFVLLGIAGGLWGGTFSKANYYWTMWFRGFPVIANNPIFEVALVTVVTVLIQFPNPLVREPGDSLIGNLLVDCRNSASQDTYVCRSEAQGDTKYIGFLIYGTLAKLFLTTVSFGIKVPSGVIIPALGGGALFGRLVGQAISSISPGIFAMVGAGAFLAGVSRMTISLCVVMFELTGELEYVLPHMIAILVAKLTADALCKEGVYDLAQAVLGHPFLDLDASMAMLQRSRLLVEDIIPSKQTMEEISVHVPRSNKVPRNLLTKKLSQLKERGLMDAGLVLLQGDDMLQGYIAEGELDFGLSELGKVYPADADVRLLGAGEEGDFDLSAFVDRTPMNVCAKAPLEYAAELIGKLGLRHLMVTEEGTGRIVGAVMKKRLVACINAMKHGGGDGTDDPH